MDTTELSQRLFDAALGAIDMWSVYVGENLGLYAALAQRGSLTGAELAASAQIHPRYAIEWLERQAVTGILEVNDADLPGDQRRYALPEAHAEVLTDPDSLNYVAPFMRLMTAAGMQLPALLEAYRTGGGVGLATVRPGHADRSGGDKSALVPGGVGNRLVSRRSRPGPAAARRRPSGRHRVR